MGSKIIFQWWTQGSSFAGMEGSTRNSSAIAGGSVELCLWPTLAAIDTWTLLSPNSRETCAPQTTVTPQVLLWDVFFLYPSLWLRAALSPGQMPSFQVCPLPLGTCQSLHFFKVQPSSNMPCRVLLACWKTGTGRESCCCRLPWQHVTFASVLSLEAIILL